MQHGTRMVAAILVLGLAAGVVAVGAGEAEEMAMAKSEGAPRKVVVGSLMYNMFHEFPGLDERLKELGGWIDKMAAEAERKYGRKLDIAALPEIAVNGGLGGPASRVSFPLEGPVLDAMGAKARQHQCYVLVPLYMVEDQEKGVYTNAAVLLGRKGEVVGIYRKVYPVVIPGTDKLEGGVIPGKDFPVFECDFGRVGIQICFDIAYDTGWEVLGRKNAELVLWTTQSPGQIKAAFRAMRHDYFVLTSTWRNNASLFDPTGHKIAEIRGPDGVLVEQIDLEYVLLPWQRELSNGRIFDEKYGDRAGYRYSEAEDGGIFWSNDPDKPITEMVRELGLKFSGHEVEESRKIQDRLRGGPPSED
jgi:predicted amidohydrolase